jgi:prepilin-type N-terminal cleavage/methylation domain-containing protein
MKQKNRRSGFTLIEMLTVIAVILLLSGLLLSVNSGVQTKAARSRAEGEIAAMSAACENYKADNGAYPRDLEVAGVPPASVTPSRTDTLDPRDTNVSVDETDQSKPNYRLASLELYKALSGNTVNPSGSLTLGTGKSYYEFKPNQLSARKDASTGLVSHVFFIQDPWGKSYGYSTAGAKFEEDYRKAVQKAASSGGAPPPRPTNPIGYNPTFDLWSTGGALTTTNIAKCVKNW